MDFKSVILEFESCFPQIREYGEDRVAQYAGKETKSVTDLLKVELLEHIRDQAYSIYQLALSLMGPKTCKLEKTLDDYMGKPTPESFPKK